MKYNGINMYRSTLALSIILVVEKNWCAFFSNDFLEWNFKNN